jgi:hypothetical protein
MSVKRIRVIILVCLIVAVAIVGASQEKYVRAAASNQQVTSREFKLLLKPEAFVNRSIGYQDVWESIASVANEMGVTVTEASNPYQEEEGDVTYLDTQDHDLYKQNYILRKRIQYENGNPISHCELMLKYRSNDLNLATAADVISSPQFKAKEKIEQDVNMDGNHIGSLKGVFSHSNSIKKIQAPVADSVADYAVIFPNLKNLNSDSQALLLPVNNVTVHEYSISPGSLEFNPGLIGKVDISIWYGADNKSPVIGEISFSYSLKNTSSEAVAMSESFFRELQKRIESKMVPGMTKTEVVYSGISK